MVQPDTIHYQDQTTASTIIILPRPRQRVLLLSSLFTLWICPQQQLWRSSVEQTYVNIWMSLSFPLLFCCVYEEACSVRITVHPSYAPAQPLQLWGPWQSVFLTSTPGDPSFASVLRNIHSLLSHKCSCCSLPATITETHDFRGHFIPLCVGVYCDHRMIFCYFLKCLFCQLH